MRGIQRWTNGGERKGQGRPGREWNGKDRTRQGCESNREGRERIGKKKGQERIGNGLGREREAKERK